jgi:hypothetical protein
MAHPPQTEKESTSIIAKCPPKTKRFVSFFMCWKTNNDASSVFERVLLPGKIMRQNWCSPYSPSLSSLAPLQ